MNGPPEWEEVVSKLLADTKNRVITWEKDQGLSRENVVGFVYATSVSGRRILIYQYSYRLCVTMDEWSPADDVAIEFASANGTLEFRFPEVSSRHELLETVRLETSGENATKRDSFRKR